MQTERLEGRREKGARVQREDRCGVASRDIDRRQALLQGPELGLGVGQPAVGFP